MDKYTDFCYWALIKYPHLSDRDLSYEYVNMGNIYKEWING